MQNKDIKNLAKILAKEDTIAKKAVDFILKLERRDLKTFLSNYKLALKRNTVVVTSASDLGADDLKNLKNIYNEQRFITKVDKSLGAGIKIEEKDNIIDFTFKKYINDTINFVK